MKIIISVLIILDLFCSLFLFSQDDSYKKINLGPNINSKAAELNPVISADGKTIYFTRRGHSENMGYGKPDFDDDIWISTLDGTGKWTPAKNMGYPLNNNCFSSVCSVSPDGMKMLLQGIFDKTDCKKKSDELYLYTSEKTKTGWSLPKKQRINNFYNKNEYADFFLSNDGKVLLMAIENLESLGDLDIYVSFLEDNGDWSSPLNLGDKINTNLKEYAPFLAADGVSLYFSSKGHGGYGDADVFVSRRLDDSWKNWSEPENLGSSINTSGADAYYVIPASGDYVYFVSTDNSYGAEDIFKVQLPGKVKPNPVILVSGKVINSKTKQPVDATIVYELPPDGGILGSLKTNPESGEFKLTLPIGHNYGFRVEAKGFVFKWDTYDARKNKEYTEVEKVIELDPIEEGQVIKLENIYFELSSSQLKTESYQSLNNVIAFLKNNQKIKIEIGGHTDSTGTKIINDTLSENRAKHVMEYIVSKDIPSDRVTFRGYGSTRPVVWNTSPENWALNRRVEFTILDENFVSNQTSELVITENKVTEETKIPEETKVPEEKNVPEEAKVPEEKNVIPENNVNQNNESLPEIICTTHFELNQIYLTVQNYLDLEQVFSYLKEHPDAEIEIAGHSDNTGGKEDANIKVSEIRAKAVKEYIISRNLTNNIINAKGYGSKKPATNNDTEQGRNLNRRVEITIIKK